LIIGTVASMASMLPVHFIGMFVLFSKLEKAFNPDRLKAIQRQKQFARRVSKKR
jgi:hypothetical protein